MSNHDFQLLPASEARRRSRPTRQLRGQLIWSFVVIVALLAGALGGQVLWDSSSAAATPTLPSNTASAPSASVAQIDSSMVDDQEALADLYDTLLPSVVNIQVQSRASSILLPQFGLPDSDGPLLTSQGSGFIYDDQGHIVTNNHVVEDAERMLVIFHNGFWAEAEMVAADPQADLAVIKVVPPDNMDWLPLHLAEAGSLRVGHTVIAIGNPFGLDGTMTTGVVSALGRGVPIGDGNTARYTLPDVVQTDAAINPGNSGGPLIDLNGNVVGVNFAIRSQERFNAGVGFAIPVSIVRRVVPDLIEEGQFHYAYLGLSGSSIGYGLAEILDLPANQLGVYVAEVIPGGPSAVAGVQGGDEVVTDESGLEFRRGGDIVTAIDDSTVQRFEDLVSYLVTQAAPGQTVTLSVLRQGEPMDIDVVLGERPSNIGQSASSERGDFNAREAIEIASEAALESGLLEGPIVEKVAVPDEIDGQSVWIVELSNGQDTVHVTVDVATGEVLDMELD